MKQLVEKRNDLIEEMEGLLSKSKAETRSFSDEESTRFDEIKKEIAKIDKTLAAEEEARSFERKEVKKVAGEAEQRALEEDKFLRFIKGEQRALDVANNGGVIPTHIANKIIEKVKELSPIYSMATVYNVGGDLVFPVYDESSSSIGAAYVDDLTELTEGTGKFTTVKLENFIVGVLAKVSKSLMNRTDFDLVSFVINKAAKAIAEFLEKELIVGTSGKMEGLSSTTNLVTAASATAVTADELIDVQMTVPEVYQGNAVWIGNKATLKALRKLKDADGNYLLGTALNGFGFTLLGKPFHISESVDTITTGKKVLYYGDMSGLHVKLAQNVEIQVLMEKYATQHAIGVVGYVECDSAIVETQKIAALKMA
ncbi:phage major capsid protein [Bacillus sp. OTU530]|uniref:phage major capsid protein n=1 Tax=Bacillus sp. OTU530 TaxID=3043862 RepID=UPI00313E585D